MMEDMESITISYQNDTNIKEPYKHLLSGIEDERIYTAFATLTNYLDETQKEVWHIYNMLKWCMKTTFYKWIIIQNKI